MCNCLVYNWGETNEHFYQKIGHLKIIIIKNKTKQKQILQSKREKHNLSFGLKQAGSLSETKRSSRILQTRQSNLSEWQQKQIQQECRQTPFKTPLTQ